MVRSMEICRSFIESNEIMKQMFTHAGISIEESFTGTIMLVMIVLISIVPILIVNKLFAEERRMRLSQLFSTKVTRSQLYWHCMGIAIFTSVVGISSSASTLGGTAISVMETPTTMEFNDFLAAGFNYFPSVFIYHWLSRISPWMDTKRRESRLYLFSVLFYGQLLWCHR